MLRIHHCFLAAGLALSSALAGCVTITPEAQVVAAKAQDGPECGGPSQPSCSFFDGPLQLASSAPVRLPNRSYPFFATLAPLGFVDAGNGRWLAQPQTLTDGASIPGLFVPIIGDPRAPQFANAAALHDAYCGIGNEGKPSFHSVDWRATHRMFYDALRVGGTNEIRAKIMFAAVYLGGPRWGADQGTDLSEKAVQTQKRARNITSFAAPGGPRVPRAEEDALAKRLQQRFSTITGQEAGQTLGFARDGLGHVSYDRFERDLSGVAPARMQQILRNTEQYIRVTKPTPSIDEIILWLERSEIRLLDDLLRVRDEDDQQDTSLPNDDNPYDGGGPGTGCDPATGVGCT